MVDEASHHSNRETYLLNLLERYEQETIELDTLTRQYGPCRQAADLPEPHRTSYQLLMPKKAMLSRHYGGLRTGDGIQQEGMRGQ